MLINEVESIVGLTKKSIYYYEENGLINPKRSSNSYRVYSKDDVKKLKTIKLLRDLGVSINDLNKLFNNELMLNECIKERIKNINNTKSNLDEISFICEDIINKDFTIDNLNINDYFVKMNVLSKEGFTLKRGNDIVNKKMIGPILSSVIVTLMFIAFISLMFWAYNLDPIPMPIFIFIIILLVIPIVGIIVNLFVRIKEIKGGEEDEASKY